MVHLGEFYYPRLSIVVLNSKALLDPDYHEVLDDVADGFPRPGAGSVANYELRATADKLIQMVAASVGHDAAVVIGAVRGAYPVPV